MRPTRILSAGSFFFASFILSSFGRLVHQPVPTGHKEDKRSKEHRTCTEHDTESDEQSDPVTPRELDGALPSASAAVRGETRQRQHLETLAQTSLLAVGMQRRAAVAGASGGLTTLKATSSARDFGADSPPPPWRLVVVELFVPLAEELLSGQGLAPVELLGSFEDERSRSFEFS